MTKYYLIPASYHEPLSNQILYEFNGHPRSILSSFNFEKLTNEHYGCSFVIVNPCVFKINSITIHVIKNNLLVFPLNNASLEYLNQICFSLPKVVCDLIFDYCQYYFILQLMCCQQIKTTCCILLNEPKYITCDLNINCRNSGGTRLWIRLLSCNGNNDDDIDFFEFDVHVITEFE